MTTPALRDLVQARDALQLARRGYHLSILIAAERGHDEHEIADALGTKPTYIANTLRNHRQNKCECGA